MSWYSDVFDLVFPDIDSDRANNVWKEMLSRPTDEDSKPHEKDDRE